MHETPESRRMSLPLEVADPEVAAAIFDEVRRQATGLELIASENFISEAVMEAMGSVLSNKYAEGYPGKRYYGGCENVDRIERLAIERAKQVFGGDHANVQAHSGAQANMAVYLSALQPGDTVLGMNLAHGGHLTHGHPLNFSGRTYKFVAYGVTKDTEMIDYDEVERLAREQAPKMIVAGASAYARIIDFPRLAKIADSVGAILFVDMAHIAGLVAAGVHPTPSRTPISFPPQRIRRYAARGAAWCFAVKNTRRTWIGRRFPASRAARSNTSSRRRPSASRRPCNRNFASTKNRCW